VSTQINVTVGSGGLSDKAKQLQAAARQAQLEKERTLDLSAEALDKRIAAQAAKGLSVDGKPLYSVPTQLPEIERRPAANRTTDLAFSVFGVRSVSTNTITIWPKEGEPTTFNLDAFPDWSPPISPITGEPMSTNRFQLFTRYPEGPENMSTLLPEAWEPPLPPGVNRPTFSCYIGSNGNKTSPGGASYDWIVSNPYYTERWQRTWTLTSNTLDLSITVVLPIKKDLSILAYKRFKIFYASYYYTDGFRYTGVDIEPAGDGVTLVLGPYVEATFADSYSPSGFEYETSACFLVSKSSVKEISVPPSVSALLDNWRPFPTTATQSVQALTIDGSPNIGQEGITQCTDINDPINNTSNGITNVTRSQTVTTYAYGAQVTMSNARTKKSYGIGLLTTTSHTQETFSPIIYTLIKDPNSKSVANNVGGANNGSYDTAKAYSEITPPNTFINVKRTLNYGGTAYTAAFAFEKTKAMPVNDTTAMPTSDFTPLKDSYNVNYSYPRGDAYTFYVAWDWNKSGYCIQQAQSLGFSSADLTP
jgi:hypothetical protein